MKCHQCSNNAMFVIGPQKIPLCLNCNALLQQTIDKENERLREEINFIQDSVDSMFGIRTGARYPTKRPVLLSGNTVNHNRIAINNSQIGIMNTGNINNLNQTIDSLYSASQKDLANIIKQFSESIITDTKINDVQKSEVLERLDIITKELFQKPESRKKLVAKALMDQITGIVRFTADALAIWQVLHPMLRNYF